MRDRTTILLALMACATTASAGEGGTVPQDAVTASARFILQLGVLVFAAKMGGLLFHRWQVSRVVGEVAAGLLLGPALLGGLALPFFPDGLMADTASWFSPGGPMHGIISLTLVVFFFLAGLDTDVRQFRQATAGAVAVGLGGFALCLAAAVAIVWLCVQDWASAARPEVLLVCVVMSTSSVGMLARLLAAQQRFESPAGRVALTAALTDNVAGIFLFTMFAGAFAATRQNAPAGGGLLPSMAALTVLVCAVIALCGLPIARWVNGLALRERAYPLAFAVAAAFLLVAAGAAAVMGLPALIGAYVTGLIFATTDLRYEIRERLDFFSAVLVPACFAALGMLINPRAFLLGHVWWDIGIFVFAVTLVKGLVNAATAWLFTGLNGIGGLRVGAALLPRGELTLALLATAVCMNALPPEEGMLFPVLALVALTCLCGPRLVEPLFAKKDSGTRKPSETPEPVKLVYQFSSHQAAMLMTNRAVEIFEDDGFYAHRLNRYQAHYRVSRAGLAVHLSAEAGNVMIECSERERSLINAVMLELSSGVEQSLRELQKPLNDVLLRRNLQSAAPASAAAVAAGMLKNRFAAETLKPRLLATTKQGTISELVSLLYENGLVMDRERAVQAVFEREQGLSTGLEHGLAIPHARTDAVSRLVCAVGIKKEGLDFDAADGKPTRIVVLVLAPDNAATPQLQLIAQVCRQLDEKGRAALLASETPEDMFAVLTGGAAAPAPDGQLAATPLAAVLQWQSVSLDLVAADQTQALSLLLALCARSGAVGAMEELRRELEACGPQPPERIGDEAALFAVETPNVFRTVAALGVSAQGAAGGNRRRVCALLLYPPSAAAGIGRVKASLARALDAEGLAALLAAKTSKEALAVLTR